MKHKGRFHMRRPLIWKQCIKIGDPHLISQINPISNAGNANLIF